jgi:hypothetical protein
MLHLIEQSVPVTLSGGVFARTLEPPADVSDLHNPYAATGVLDGFYKCVNHLLQPYQSRLS